ncbi:MAG TPA: EamA family transporter [Flavisolibacter sp.]|jgi:drug/metabolite transporter (DMT)-like permease|nr:EamA family transporter [Flavisolibacter sp.]
MMQELLTASAVLLRILCNPLGNVYQKKLTAKGWHPLLVNVLTYLILSLAALLLAIFLKWPQVSLSFWIYALAGGLAGGLGNGFLVKALAKGDLSVLGPVNSYKSIVGLLTGILLLQEWPGLWGLAGMAVIIAGSYFVLDTTDDRFSWKLLKRKEIQYRIWALVLTAIEAVFVKKVILASSVPISFICWSIFGALFSLLFLKLERFPLKQELAALKGRDAYGLIRIVLCIGLMQLTSAYSFQHMPVGYALALFQLSSIVSVWLGYKIFQETQIRKKVIGSLIMIAGSVMIVFG